jgi:hypothetical protein
MHICYVTGNKILDKFSFFSCDSHLQEVARFSMYISVPMFSSCIYANPERMHSISESYKLFSIIIMTPPTTELIFQSNQIQRLPL